MIILAIVLVRGLMPVAFGYTICKPCGRSLLSLAARCARDSMGTHFCPLRCDELGPSVEELSKGGADLAQRLSRLPFLSIFGRT